MAYDNRNSGFVGKNRKKETEKHPDITGFAEVDGKEYWVAGWKNEKGYGLKFTLKDEQAKPKDTMADLADDIPW